MPLLKQPAWWVCISYVDHDVDVVPVDDYRRAKQLAKASLGDGVLEVEIFDFEGQMIYSSDKSRHDPHTMTEPAQPGRFRWDEEAQALKMIEAQEAA